MKALTLDEINTETKEGQMAMMLLACVTARVYTEMDPDEALQHVHDVSYEAMFGDKKIDTK